MNKVTISLVTLLLMFVVMNGYLLKQNLELRSSLRKLEPDILEVGDRVEPFTASGLFGTAINVQYSASSPKRVFLFFSPSCPFSRMQFPFWNKVIRDAPMKGMQVIALAPDSEDKSKIEEFLRTVGCPNESESFHVGLIPRQVGLNYKLTRTPTTLIVSKHGVAEYASSGAWTANDVAKVSASLGFQVAR